MRLMRVGAPGQERPSVHLEGDSYIDVSDVVRDFDAAFWAGGLDVLRDVVEYRRSTGQVSELAGERIGSPVPRPHQLLCLGQNYNDEPPGEPVVFTKSPNTVVGPNDVVRIPRGADKTDGEVELGVVVGRRCRYLEDEQAAELAIAGYVLVNDVSERTFELEHGDQWVKGKSAETFNPCGPWLVTPDEIDVRHLAMWLEVNGERRQAGTTRSMVFSPAYVIHYLSQYMVLEPGDLINTGTPPGSGMSFDPPVYLKPGDVMELGIDGLGTQRQYVMAAE